ncbi:carboxymuconolactone decarboxylase family protein [Methanosarcina acetivorans]|uniref:Carboxymuconolactone decarboxylase-like domain-containing protein n=1 Tax=Methanosarcina acetivorans (strain ATCC 35395 / DSM 2834 / JCM 12185 / C2A) TaxID=188937 RepID=Q8TN24_METAC|nr:carboxymuconolactone decarboxylase family protein [Methanosarcina acetivorans]AAM05855.1 hypothetical protein (multi-domain) [Methanosarcina acetivorans C2A]
MKRPTEPRIPPVDTASMTENQRVLAGIGASNVIRTLVRHEDLFTSWLALGEMLLVRGRLSPRDRELAILRVALRTECEYEWANHSLGALGAGVTGTEIDALSSESASWSDADAALLRAVDELCSDDCVSDDTWTALKTTRDDVQIIEILFVVGYYRMTAGFLNSAGVQPEPGRPHLGQLPVVSPPRSPAPRRPETSIKNGVTTTGERRTAVGGTWQVVFHHPAADLDLTLVVDTSSGGISGSVTSPSQGTSVQIVEGTVEGNRFSFRAPVTTPLKMEIRYDGIVDGDLISGHITIQGTGTFSFDGIRV